jgi:serine/alanine adding enzyme
MTSRRPAARAPVRSTADLAVVPEREWDEVVSALGVDDTYPTLSYHRVAALLEPPGTQPVLLRYGNGGSRVLLPLLLRPLPDGSGWDAVSAYGYGGPVGPASADPVGFGVALDGWARENQVVASFLRLHPLLGNAGLVPPGAELVPLGPTVAWNVSADRPLRELAHTHHRRSVRKADRAGLTTTVVHRPTDLDEFAALYAVTMQRQQAASFYFFPPAYWDALVAESAALELVLVEGRLDGRLEAALLCFGSGPWLHYHLGASSEAARSIGASVRCFFAAGEWAQTRGMTRFHLGGGVRGSPDSSLFVFKQRFDPDTVPLAFSVAKLVHDPERYLSLAGTSSTAGFFPPWRSGQ